MNTVSFSSEQIKAGTKIKGNVNNAIMEIIKIENEANAVVRDCKTGHIFQYGLEALKRCNITILE